MIDARFTHVVEAGLDRWLTVTNGAVDKQLAELDANRQMLLYVLNQALALPQLAGKAAQLVVQVSHFPEKVGYTREWVPYVQRALARVSADSPLRPRLYNRLGAALQISGDPHGAIRAHETAMDMARRHALHDEFADAHFLLGNVYYHRSDSDNAERFAREALHLRVHHGLDKPAPVAAAYNLLGLVELTLMRLTSAQALFLDAIDQWKKTEQRVYHARTLLNLGVAYNTGQQYDEAVHAYHDALKQLPEGALPIERARINLNLGTVYYDQQKWLDALLYYQFANTREVQDSGDRRLIGMIWTSLGDTLIEIGELEEGERHLRGGLAIWEALGDDPVNYANALGAQAHLLAQRGQVADAHAAYQRALALLCEPRRRNSWAEELDGKFRRRLAEIGGTAVPCPA